ncbi:MAG: fumarylpyruvate hydrolase [Hyphomicrobiaceae bacterium]|jgi:fumarylpyruvate hydrolase
MNFVIPPRPQASLPVAGSDKHFPVNRVYCVGRNYAEHAREMGHDPDREPPFFFQKNPHNLDTSGEFPYPVKSQDVHWEIEMMAALKSGGKDIAEADALNHVFGYGIALDMTRRDLQGEAKKMGRPWEIGKAFDRSAPCTSLVPATETGHLAKGAIWLDVNGDRKQDGDLAQMIWSIPEQIAYLSSHFELHAGDVILTGTPAGVSACKRGDKFTGHVDGLPDLNVTVI